MHATMSRLWQHATDLLRTRLDESIRLRAHRFHDRKEAWFRWFFGRSLVGRLIATYTTADDWTNVRYPLAVVLGLSIATRNFGLAFETMFAVGLTDFIDGPLARFQETAGPEGTWNESRADSVNLLVVFIGLAIIARYPPMRIIFILAAILEVTRLGGCAYYRGNGVDPTGLKPNMSGKWKMAFYVSGTMLSFLPMHWAPAALMLAIGIELSFHSQLRHLPELEAMLHRRQR